MVRCLMSNMDESARETSARITKWIDERDARIRRETIEECKRVFTGLYEGSPIVRIQIERAMDALAEDQP